MYGGTTNGGMDGGRRGRVKCGSGIETQVEAGKGAGRGIMSKLQTRGRKNSCSVGLQAAMWPGIEGCVNRTEKRQRWWRVFGRLRRQSTRACALSGHTKERLEIVVRRWHVTTLARCVQR